MGPLWVTRDEGKNEEGVSQAVCTSDAHVSKGKQGKIGQRTVENLSEIFWYRKWVRGIKTPCLRVSFNFRKL